MSNRIVFAAISLLLPLAVVAAESEFRVHSAIWCSGELRGQPELLLSPGETESFEIHASDATWRLNVEVEEPGATENAAPDSVWFKVGIEQQIDGEWQFLTDTMLGTPLGESGRISVVDEGGPEGPEGAPLYVELTAHRVEGETPKDE